MVVNLHCYYTIQFNDSVLCVFKHPVFIALLQTMLQTQTENRGDQTRAIRLVVNVNVKLQVTECTEALLQLDIFNALCLRGLRIPNRLVAFYILLCHS